MFAPATPLASNSLSTGASQTIHPARASSVESCGLLAASLAANNSAHSKKCTRYSPISSRLPSRNRLQYMLNTSTAKSQTYMTFPRTTSPRPTGVWSPTTPINVRCVNESINHCKEKRETSATMNQPVKSLFGQIVCDQTDRHH